MGLVHGEKVVRAFDRAIEARLPCGGRDPVGWGPHAGGHGRPGAAGPDIAAAPVGHHGAGLLSVCGAPVARPRAGCSPPTARSPTCGWRRPGRRSGSPGPAWWSRHRHRRDGPVAHGGVGAGGRVWSMPWWLPTDLGSRGWRGPSARRVPVGGRPPAGGRRCGTDRIAVPGGPAWTEVQAARPSVGPPASTWPPRLCTVVGRARRRHRPGPCAPALATIGGRPGGRGGQRSLRRPTGRPPARRASASPERGIALAGRLGLPVVTLRRHVRAPSPVPTPRTPASPARSPAPSPPWPTVPVHHRDRGHRPRPVRAMLLADMGADVIRVDRSGNVIGRRPRRPPATSATAVGARSAST
jgi:hypothetical protein